MKRHDYKAGDEQTVALALAMLKEARNLLKQVGAVKTVERVRLAISSAKGAKRAVMYREMRGLYKARLAAQQAQEGTP